MRDENKVTIMPIEGFAYGFIPAEYLKEGEDEYHFRFQQVPNEGYRQLTEEEIRQLEDLNNSASNWDDVLVKDPFDPTTIRRTSFFGLVRLGPFEKKMASFHDLMLEVGITDSRIISSDILENAAVHNCPFVSHYIIGKEAIVYRIGELQTTNHAKFGIGLVKEGESEDVRTTVDLMNEAGGREVLPFVGMNTADAYLWARHRERPLVMQKFKDFTEKTFTIRRGVYGQVGQHCVIKSCHVIKDVNFGPGAYVKGCNKLKNLSVDSSESEPAQLGEGIELVNGIIGKACHIFYGCKAIRFVMGSHCNLKYGARLIHSFLGDNSTISCCEVLNNLIFPFHEEHHNNSFLIATLVKGQSNMAAGATIGSNHNSRGNDGELVAGRGFWPALSTTVKHDCRFASFVLLTKGNYPSELDIPFPFSMLCDNPKKGRREIMPAYWWMYNMYALARNSWKFHARDKRKERPVNIETDFLAPDTVNEIIKALRLLEYWTGRSAFETEKDEEEYISYGRYLLTRGEKLGFEVLAQGLEKSPFPVRILKPVKSYAAYLDMILFYAMKTISDAANKHSMGIRSLLEQYPSTAPEEFSNLGGQLVPKAKEAKLLDEVEMGVINSWDEMHSAYTRLAEEYEEDRLCHAIAVLALLAERNSSTIAELYSSWNERCLVLNEWIRSEAVKTKQKDYANAFRHITYETEEEREAVLGSKIETVSFDLPIYTPAKF